MLNLKKAWHTRKMLEAVHLHQWRDVKEALEKGADPQAERNVVLRHAASYGATDVVVLALEKGARASADNNEAVNMAVANANLEIFDVLVKHDPLIILGVRQGALAIPRYRGAHSDDPVYRERAAQMVRRVEEVSTETVAAILGDNTESTRAGKEKRVLKGFNL